MNGYIESRVVLGLVVVMNLMIAYGSNSVHRHISKGLWNGLFIVQALVVTLYIVANPIQNGYCMALFGYIFVYFFMFLGWVSWLPNTVLESGKVYMMKPDSMFIYNHEHYISGTVKTSITETQVLLKNEPPHLMPQQTIAVKLLYISNGNIFVTLA
jgi:hypothetical protein